jgi:hypothetical protein
MESEPFDQRCEPPGMGIGCVREVARPLGQAEAQLIGRDAPVGGALLARLGVGALLAWSCLFTTRACWSTR